MLRPTLGVCLIPILTLALAACAGNDPPAAPNPDPVQAQAPTDAPPKTAETPTVNEATKDSPWHWQADDADAAGNPQYLLGLVGQTGIEHCPGGGFDRKWLGVRPTVGRVTVSGPEDAVLEPLMDKPVLAVGLAGEAPPRPAITETIEPCLPAQMRSDWRMTPRGLLIERGASAGIGHFQLAMVRPLDELRVRIDGEHLIVSFTNPVPVALREVELVVHYEGCFGKPGSSVETTTVGELGVRAEASARVPTLLRKDGEPAGRARFRAYSVELRAQGERVLIDLDVPLVHLGAGVECPNG